MKRIATIFCVAFVFAGQANAMTLVETSGKGSAAVPAPSHVQLGGKLEVIYASASKLVIGGVTYSYNPLTTIVTINGKRSTISDLHSGETVQFQTVSQGVHTPALLTSISVQR